MKQLHKLILATCLLLSCNIAQGQNVSGLPTPAFQWKCQSADSRLNFHPATIAPLHFDSIPYAEDYTIVVVYKPVADTEATVWQLVFADSIVRGLTTERIVSDSTSIRYSQQSDRKPVIHTLRQSAPDISSANVRLSVGDGNIKVSEVLYFNHRLGNSALRRVQSALAIRYGITLGPVDYIGGNGNRVWQHRRDSAMFHHRITGVGSDTACNLHQLCSRSEMDGSVVTLSADSLPQGAYLLVGDNDAPLTFQQKDGDVETLARQWRVQASGAEGVDFSLSFDTRRIPIPTDSLVLLLDDNVVLPSVAATNEVRFDNLWLPSDTCTFTLARGTLLWQLAQSGTKGAKGHGGKEYGGNEEFSISNSQFSIFPNPTTGHFNIEVSGARQVQVTIYSLQGKVMATYNDSDRDKYCFEGSLPSGNSYYATITTESGSQTMKLVVK
ncbi:MAG: T9SS type A sorting domain-containing protein [Bacteroidales bacterium]|nr:T9SS type A sorting domain-containing protein [Bacteroidales bacterium]